MSSSISSIDYWTNGSGAMFLSYKVFLGLSVLGGFFALDHLYLRSPRSFLFKLLINVFFFGVWWFYDAFQAFFHTDIVKVFGLSVPGLGPQGIAAGVLASDEPDSKHWAFFVYSLAILLGGYFGVDSFLVGDKKNGFIRLASAILFPVALGLWAYNLYYFFVKTKDLTDYYPEYFGSSPASKQASTLENSFLSYFPFLGTLFKSTPLLDPIAKTLQVGLQTVDTAVSTVEQGLKLGTTAIEQSSQLTSKLANTAQKATEALTLAPAAATLSQQVTADSIQKALSDLPQKGGAISEYGMVSYVLVTTLVLVSVSGFVVSYLRTKKNGQPTRNDAPPEPGILRKPDQKESSHSP